MIEQKSVIANDDPETIKINEKIMEEKRVEATAVMVEAYNNIQLILRKYCDLKDEYYNIITLWILGTYIHEEFVSFPYLFFNAMKGSGKSRLLKLVTHLSRGGKQLTSLTEAVIFRTKGTLGIDEFEGITRKGGEALRELLNASYKKGNLVSRMRKVKAMDGEKQVVETFNLYRPIVMANIWGMESVLGDRCINLVLERSNNKKVTKLVEDFENDVVIGDTLHLLNNTIYTSSDDQKPGFTQDRCSLCSVVVARKVYIEWNNYILQTTHTENYTNYTKLHKLFKKIDESGMDGRHLELSFPLLLLAEVISDFALDETLKTLKEIMNDKNSDDVLENTDVSLIDFISQQVNSQYYKQINDLTKEFREFMNSNEEWINSKWMGRGLKRLNLITNKRRIGRGVEVMLDVAKAQEKIKIFKYDNEEEM